MDFRIADTFVDSLARLNNQEQKAVKTTVFDLQVNPSSPGMSFHKLDKAKDKNFWSVRVNRDIRLIVPASRIPPATNVLISPNVVPSQRQMGVSPSASDTRGEGAS